MKKSKRILAGVFALAGMISMLFLAACPDPIKPDVTYDITVVTPQNGTLTADVAKAEAGKTVRLTATPAADYKFGSLTVTGSGGAVTTTPAGGANYTFVMPNYNVTVTATFEADLPPGEYAVTKGAITPPAGGDLTIAPEVAKEGDTITLTVTANDGYELGSSPVVTGASGTVQVAGSYPTFTFEMPAENVTVTATFVAIDAPKFAITIGTLSNGEIEADVSEAAATVPVTLTVTPDSGYELDGLPVVTGASGTVTVTLVAGNEYTFVMPGEAVTVTATFKARTFNVTLTLPALNGTFASDKQTAAEDEIVKITVTPNSGYEVGGNPTVTGSGGAVHVTHVAGNEYTFEMPAYDVTVSVSFVEEGAPKFAITIGTLSNGEIEADADEAAETVHVTLTVKPASGYELDGLPVVTGASGAVTVTAGAANEYTFEMPGEAVTVTATFKIITYTVGLTLPVNNGTLSADKTDAAENDDVTITATPNIGYELEGGLPVVTFGASGTVTVTAGADNTFTFKMPASDVTVTVTYVLKSYTITKGTHANGDFTIDKATANFDELVTLTPTANATYRFVEFTAVPPEGVTFTVAGATRTFTMPANDVTINATFELIPTFALTKGTMTGGDFTFTPASPIAEGVAVNLTAAPADFYNFVEFTASPAAGVSFTGTGLTRTFNMPANAVTITAVFQALPSYAVNIATGITGGTITRNPATARQGQTVTLTQTATGSNVFGGFTFTPSTVSATFEAGVWSFTMPASEVTVGARFLSPTDDIALGRGGFSMSSGDRGLDGTNQSWSYSAFNDNTMYWQIPDSASGGREAWIGVDLGAEFNLGWVRVNWGAAADMMVNADIQVRNDAPAWWSPVVLNETGTAGTGGTENNLSLSDDGWTKVGELRQIPRTAFDMANPNPGTVLIKLDENASGRYIRLKRKAPNTAVNSVAGTTPETPQLWSTWARVLRMQVYMPQGVTANAVNKGTITGNGDFTISSATAGQGQIITLTAAPNTDNILSNFTLTPTTALRRLSTADNNTWQFTMPASAVTVTATFVSSNPRSITVAPVPANGNLNVAPAEALFGEPITITPAPAAGYRLDRLTFTPDTVTPARVGTTNNFTFSMPADDVVISALFKQIQPVGTSYLIEDFDLPAGPYVEHHNVVRDITYWRWSNAASETTNYGSFTDSQGVTKLGTSYLTTAASGGGTQIGAKFARTSVAVNKVIDLTPYTHISVWFKAAVPAPVIFILENPDAGNMNGSFIGEVQYPQTVNITEADEWQEFLIPLTGFGAANLTRVNGWRINFQTRNVNYWLGPIEAIVVQPLAITVATGIPNGTIEVSPNPASPGSTVTVTAQPSSGYRLNTVTVTPAQTVSGTGNTRTFVMPNETVAVTATFEALPTVSFLGRTIPLDTVSNNGTTASFSNAPALNGWFAEGNHAGVTARAGSFDNDVPAGSPNTQSVRMTWNGTSGQTARIVRLGYAPLNPTINASGFNQVRFSVKATNITGATFNFVHRNSGSNTDRSTNFTISEANTWQDVTVNLNSTPANREALIYAAIEASYSQTAVTNASIWIDNVRFVTMQEQATLTIDAVADKTVGDAPFQLATTGGSGTGDVTFTRASGTAATVSASGLVTINSAGVITVTATKAGDTTYNPITSAPRTITINAATGAPKTITINFADIENLDIPIDGGNLTIGGSINLDASSLTGYTFEWRYNGATIGTDPTYTVTSGLFGNKFDDYSITLFASRNNMTYGKTIKITLGP